MARAIAFVAHTASRSIAEPADLLRTVMISGCALALIAAGQVLPF